MLRLMKSLALIAAAMITMASPVLAQSETDSGQISTQRQKLYLNADGTWSPLIQVRAPSPLPIAGGTANTVLSTANPLPVALYIGGGTTPLSVSGTSTDTTSTSGTASRMEVNAVTRIVNAAGTLARQYQIDAVTASGTGVTAVGMAGSSFTNVTSATTTTIKSGAGIWQNMSVNTPAAGTITCYANTAASGTKIGTWTTTTGQPFALTLNYYFTTGLTCVTSVSMDVTFGYR